MRLIFRSFREKISDLAMRVAVPLAKNVLLPIVFSAADSTANWQKEEKIYTTWSSF